MLHSERSASQIISSSSSSVMDPVGKQRVSGSRRTGGIGGLDDCCRSTSESAQAGQTLPSWKGLQWGLNPCPLGPNALLGYESWIGLVIIVGTAVNATKLGSNKYQLLLIVVWIQLLWHTCNMVQITAIWISACSWWIVDTASLHIDTECHTCRLCLLT